MLLVIYHRIMNNEYIKKLEWRYAVKKFDPAKKLSEAQLSLVLEAGRLAPSSRGLQAWKILVVKNPELRAQLRNASWNQSQITDASHLLVLCAKKDIGEEFVGHYMETIAHERGVALETLDEFRKSILHGLSAQSEEEKKEWMARQVYIMLGFILSACAENDIDACPMEGFDSKKFDEILGLSREGLESCVICPIGFRSDDDSFASLKKVRFPKEEIVKEI